jgi:hypothetical protein
MFGRALFGFVWLLIGAGLLLPAYRAPVPTPGLTTLDVADAGSEPVTAACAGCRDAEDASPICPPGCSCAYVVVATPAGPDLAVRVTLKLLVWARPVEVRPMPPRIPSI